MSAGIGGEPIEYAEIQLGEHKAAELVWQLVLRMAGLDVPGKDYYALLQGKQQNNRNTSCHCNEYPLY